MESFNHQHVQELLERVAKRTLRDGATANQLLVKVVRLAALIGVTNPPTYEAKNVAEQLADQFDRAADKSKGQRRHLLQSTKDIAAVAEAIEKWLIQRREESKPQRGAFNIDYFMLEESSVCYLLEKRERRKNVRVPESDYQAVVAALADSIEKPAKFGELFEQFVKHGGQNVPSKYPLRVVLRYFRTLDPPLVVKKGVRYAPAANTRSEFRQEATRAWRNLPQNHK